MDSDGVGLFKVTWINGNGKKVNEREFDIGEFDLALAFFLNRLSEPQTRRVDIAADRTGRHDQRFGALQAHLLGHKS